MSEALRLVGYALAYFALLTAVGSAPALLLGRRLAVHPLVLAPITGFALAMALLTTASAVLTMDQASWAVLLPAAIVSLGAATILVVRRPIGWSWRELVPPGILTAAGLVIALAAGVARGTVGPLSLNVFDALGYIPTDQWLRGHTSGTSLPANYDADLVLRAGHYYGSGNQRIGVDALNGATSSLFGTSPDATHLAQLAVLFAIVPLGVWLIARTLGVGRLPATLGAAFTLTPAIFTMVADSTLANLAACALTPATLVAIALAVWERDLRLALLAGVLGAGLISAFPEFLPPLVVTCGIGAIVALVRIVRAGRTTPRTFVTAVAAGATACVLAALLAPVAVARGVDYLQTLSGDQSVTAGLPPRYLSVQDIGSWAFGTLHLYQLSRWDQLSTAKMAFAIVLPILLAALVVVGVARRRWGPLVLVVVPIVVSAIFAQVAYNRYQSGHCQYCGWKALTFGVPFLAAGVALGVDRMVGWGRQARGALRFALPGVGVGLASLGLAAAAVADERLGVAVYRTSSAVDTSLRRVIGAADDLPGRPTVMLEGLDGRLNPFYVLALTYFLLEGERAQPVFDAGNTGGVPYLTPPDPPTRRYWRSNYRYVLTSYPGLRSGRTTIASHGTYALQRRAPIDVTPVRTGFSVDEGAGAASIPWVLQPFQLWVSGRPATGPAALRIGLDRPQSDGSTLTLSYHGRTLPVTRAAEGGRLCIDLPASSAQPLVLDVQPRPVLPPPAVSRPLETDPVPPPPKAIGITDLHATAGRCTPADGIVIPDLRYLAGWWQQEAPGPDGRPFRWSRGPATLALGQPGVRRDPVRLSTTLSSFARTRKVAISIDGRTVVQTIAPAQGIRRISFVVPRGRGVARVSFTPAPGAQRVSYAPDGDHRRVAVQLGLPRLTPEAGG